MSRIGKKPISIPAGVEVKVADNNLVTVKGPKGTLTQKVDSELQWKQKEQLRERSERNAFSKG